MLRQVLQRINFVSCPAPFVRPISHLAIHNETVEEMICRLAIDRLLHRFQASLLGTSASLGETMRMVGTCVRP